MNHLAKNIHETQKQHHLVDKPPHTDWQHTHNTDRYTTVIQCCQHILGPVLPICRASQETDKEHHSKK